MVFYPLDTSASIMPAVTNARKTSFFRLEVVLRQVVDRLRLQQTLNRLTPRYGHLFVSLKRTWKDWILVSLPSPPVVESDGPVDCHGRDVHRLGTPLVRFRVNGSCLALEVSHIAADGIGARQLLKAVLEDYLGNQATPAEQNIPPEEYEDSSLRHARPGTPWPTRQALAWTLRDEQLPVGQYRTTRLRLSLRAVKARATNWGLTLTEYLAMIHLLTLKALYSEQQKHPGGQKTGRINLMIPIDLRQGFPSVTLRNFIGMAVISLDPQVDSFALDDLAAQVRRHVRQQKQTSETVKQISRNALAAKNPLVRFLPLFIKQPLYRLSYRFFGESMVTSHLSNLGPFEQGGTVGDEVAAVHFLPGGSERPGIAVGVVSLGDDLTLGFGSLFEGDAFERTFVTLLVADHLNPARVDGSSRAGHSLSL